MAGLALTGYLVPFAALQLVSGTIGERVGRTRATRAAFVIYALAAAAATALASGYGAFLAASERPGSSPDGLPAARPTATAQPASPSRARCRAASCCR